MAEVAGNHHRRKGRKCRIAGWVLLSVGALIALVWWVSRPWSFSVTFGHWSADVYRGQVELARLEADAYASRFMVTPIQPEYQAIDWRAKTQDELGAPAGAWGWTTPVLSYATWPTVSLTGVTSAHGARRCAFVLWPLVLLVGGGGGALLWWERRVAQRVMAGRCGGCGYDLAGLEAGVACPECGAGKAQ